MRTIRRSGAQNLPPDADHVSSHVTVSSMPPKTGTLLSVMAPCGVQLSVRIKETEGSREEWSGWADVLPGKEKDLQRAGVPASDKEAPMRVFSWQVITD